MGLLVATVDNMGGSSRQRHGAYGGNAAVRVGERIHTVMWRERVSQADLASVIGVSQSTLSKKLRGRVPITVAELVAIAEALGVEPGDLLPRRARVAAAVGVPSPRPAHAYS